MKAPSSTFVLALDQGTTSSRALLFDAGGVVRGVAQSEITQHYPRPGWVEHDPREIWATQLQTAREVLEQSGVSAERVAAVGITNQRETALLWDRATGEPLCNAIVWQDRRTAGFCDALREDGAEPLLQEKTGLVLDAYFSASKFRWLLDNVPGARERAERGEVALGTVDSWLVWNLTGGRRFVTDASNASRTLLYGLETGDWDDELLALFGVPRAALPAVCASDGIEAETLSELLGAPIPVTAALGDQQASLFGQACFSPGQAKNTYGTGCFLLRNTGGDAAPSPHRLLKTVAWRRHGAAADEFALEGSVFVGGAVVQWLRDGLGLVKSAAEVEELARTVPDSGGVYLVPAFAGLGAPHWDQYARGTITGLTRGTTAGHLARAALEGIAFQVADVLDVMQSDSAAPLAELRVDGGASANGLLMQFQADLLGLPVVRPAVLETTALGAAYMAGLAAGVWGGPDDVRALWRADRVFEPAMSRDEAAHRRARWREALSRAKDWEEREAA
jgi:glycerol kinase